MTGTAASSATSGRGAPPQNCTTDTIHTMQDDFEARRAARANWPIQKAKVADDGADATGTSPEQRVGMMWELVVQAWAVAGRTIPTCDRANTPIRKRRRGGPEDT